MADKMRYDPATGKWVPVSGTSSSSSSSSSGRSSSTSSSSSYSGGSSSSSRSTTRSSPTGSKPPTTGQTGTQTKSDAEAKKEQVYMEYNTLQGELVLVARVGLLAIKQNTTIRLEGVGSFLSGLYYVSDVRYTYSSSSGFSMHCTLIKTGFGPSLKGQPVEDKREDEIEKTPEDFKVGDKVKIVGDDATYSNASAGVKVPEWVKQKTLTIQKISNDGTTVLLQEILSWTYTKFLQKV